MNVKKIDESKVDEIIKQAEKTALPCCHEPAAPLSTSNASAKKKSGESLSLIFIFILLVMSMIQSLELISLRDQIQKGQFNTEANSPASGGSQNLPAQQGGC